MRDSCPFLAVASFRLLSGRRDAPGVSGRVGTWRVFGFERGHFAGTSELETKIVA